MKISEHLLKTKNYLLDLLYPKHLKCMFCTEELNEKSLNDTCENCLESLPFIDNFCLKCGSPVNKENIGVCDKCKTVNFDFTYARSVFGYSGKVVNLIQKLKYGNKTYMIEPLAKYLAQTYALQDFKADIITYVPMHKNKLKKRDYNQTELLATKLSEELKLPFSSLCEKVIDTPSQTDLNIAERLNNVKDSFKIIKKQKDNIKNKLILIVDDVITTGATSNEISKLLLDHGAKACFVLTVAHSYIEKENLNYFSAKSNT